jgi:mono/diheme cytochrome c family protein
VVFRISLAAAALLAAFLSAPAAVAQERERPDLSEELLADADLIARGQELFHDQCTLCHGRAAYPGKAPMLRPGRYTPEFVYDRVAFGFRDMPAWEHAYPEEDLVAMVAYILSARFSQRPLPGRQRRGGRRRRRNLAIGWPKMRCRTAQKTGRRGWCAGEDSNP